MATEDIKVRDGRITVERIEGKENVDVAVSDVDSVTFARSSFGGPGALVLETAKGNVVIHVENDDAGKALSLVRSALKKDEQPAAPTKTRATASSDK